MEYDILILAIRLILLIVMVALMVVIIKHYITARKLYRQLKEDFEYYKGHGTGEV